MRPPHNATDRKHFAQQVRAALYEKDLTQLHIARQLGVTQQAVNDWVHGKKMPGRKNLDNLVALLGLAESSLSTSPGQQASSEGTGGTITFLFTLNGQPFYEVDLLVTGSRLVADKITLDVPADAAAILKGDIKE